MTVVFPLLLSGLALLAIPVALHLLRGPTTQRLPFPALRLLQQRRRPVWRRAPLHHPWLLMVRLLLLAMVCLAVARPRALTAWLNLRTQRPVAAVLIFDTRASMDYRVDGQSRLQEAKRLGID